MKIGSLRHRITFEELQEDESWSTYRTVWASVSLNGNSITVVVRFLPVDDNIHRIVWRDTIYEITNIENPEGRNRELFIQAENPLGNTVSI